jgi:hypothetical protein
MKKPDVLPVVIEDEDCECSDISIDSPECVDPFVGISVLSRRTGVPWNKLHKWAGEGLIPHCHRPGERRMFPERKATQAVRNILREGGLN